MGIFKNLKESVTGIAARLTEKRSVSALGFSIMQDGTAEFYAPSGQLLYQTDIIQQAVRCIANEMSKVTPRHVIKRNGDTMAQDDTLDYILQHPNETMTLSDFLQKVTWTLFLNSNAFVLPVWDDAGGLSALYPLPGGSYELSVKDGRTILKYTDAAAKIWTWDYDNIIHLRLDYSVSDWLGGNVNGGPNYASLARLIKINDRILTGVERSVNGMGITGTLTYNTKMARDKAEKDLKDLEALLDRSASGIIPLDTGASFQQLTRQTAQISADTIKFIDEKILRYFGVSQKILSGDFTREEYEAFYQKVLEPIIIAWGQAFSDVLLTRREQQGFGHRVVFYVEPLEFMTTAQKLEMVRLLGDRGALYENEGRQILGLQPLPELNGVRMYSLNYENVSRETDKNETDQNGTGDGPEGAQN